MKPKKQIHHLAEKYNLQIIYAFGSRAKEALDMINGRIIYYSLTTIH